MQLLQQQVQLLQQQVQLHPAISCHSADNIDRSLGSAEGKGLISSITEDAGLIFARVINGRLLLLTDGESVFPDPRLRE